MVGNDSLVHCARFCPDVLISLQNTLFYIPLYLLPIEGADVVLGMEWLQNLGLISADFSIPSISSLDDNHTITLKGDPPKQPDPST